jgi:hypothetical protein
MWILLSGVYWGIVTNKMGIVYSVLEKRQNGGGFCVIAIFAVLI